jgi:hypothetical protein
MTRVLLRPTRLPDLPHAIGEPLLYRIRAITALVQDRVIGLGGVAFPPRGPAIAFVQLVPAQSDPAGLDRDPAKTIPEARQYPVAFHRAGLMVMTLIRAWGIREVVATADAGSAVAVRWLKRLGFEPTDSRPIDGKVLFIWRRDDSLGDLGISKSTRSRGRSGKAGPTISGSAESMQDQGKADHHGGGRCRA